MNCPECGVQEGEYHDELCVVEECPLCGEPRHDCECDWKKVTAVARRRFVWWPNICARCGKMNPAIFMASDWMDVVGPGKSQVYLCKKCFKEIRRLVNGK